MIVMDNFKVMDISESFMKDSYPMEDGGSHSDMMWWDFNNPLTEREIYIDKTLDKLGIEDRSEYSGVEYWWSTRVKGEGLKIHQDKDETLWNTESKMVHPIVSIITFPIESKISGGDFYFVDEKFGTDPYDFHQFNNSVYQRISYKHNRLIVLDPGNQFHGVSEIYSGERHNFVMNLWDQELKK